MVKNSTIPNLPLGRGTLLSLLMLLFATVLSGCAGGYRVNIQQDVQPLAADREIPEQDLLNVAIEVFDPGRLPEDPKKRAGLSQEIRQAEALFYPVQLKNTLQRSGFWGSIWVVPKAAIQNRWDDEKKQVEAIHTSFGTPASSSSAQGAIVAPSENSGEVADLMVAGRIEYSDGETLSLRIKAVDASNRVWLDKIYTEKSLPTEREEAELGQKDAFQDLFNAISNDLITHRQALTSKDIQIIQKIAEMRFARSIARNPFERYLSADPENNTLQLRGLPAKDDPMLKRIQAIRARDAMLMDLLSSHYDLYYTEIFTPYKEWRKNRAEELAVMHDLEKQAFRRQLLGFAAIAGAIALGAVGGEDAVRVLDPVRDIMVMGGAYAIYSGHQKREEAKLNREVIEELGESFASDAHPLVVEVKGETIKLTGSAAQQYSQWKTLLKRIYREETGGPIDTLPVIIGIEDQQMAESDGVAGEDRGQNRP